MDFSTLDTKTPAERGAFLHLRHPVTGEHLHDDSGKPIGMMVRGLESKTAQDHLKRLEKSRLKGASAEDTGFGVVSSLVIGFVGVDRAGVPLTISGDDLQWFFGLSDSFVDQVMAFARDRSSFFAPASPDASLPPGK